MFFPAPRQPHDSGDQTDFVVADGFVSFTDEFKYLGSIIHNTLTSEADVEFRISKARAAFGSLRECFFKSKRVKDRDKGKVYKVLVLTILLYGSECWCLTQTLLRRLQSFHNWCARSMCRINMRQVHKHRIRTTTLFQRLGIYSLDTYYHTRLLRWAGHAARMPMTRLPRKLFTGFARNPRPVGAPQMTFGRTLNKALKARNITTTFAGPRGWSKIAQDRAKWFKKCNPHKLPY
jgi:hypothetical protein